MQYGGFKPAPGVTRLYSRVPLDRVGVLIGEGGKVLHAVPTDGDVDRIPHVYGGGLIPSAYAIEIAILHDEVI